MLYEDHLKIREDLLAGRIPKRLFIRLTFTLEAACGLAGLDLCRAHYDPEIKNKAMRSICETFYSDTFPIENVRFPAVYQTLGAKNWVMSSNGMMQHPEITSFTPDDYESFIENPYAVILEKVLPKICKALEGDKFHAALAFAKAYNLFLQTAGQEGASIAEISKEFGYVPGWFVGGFCEAPFDFIADQLRGFKGINIDVRRCPDLLERVVNAALPLMLKLAIPRKVPLNHIVFIPLHLAPYLRPKDFERLYWPSFEKLVSTCADTGIRSFLFAEVDWTPYVSFLEKLPKGTIIQFERGDYKKIKETFGNKHVFGGFFDPTMTLTHSKEECIDWVKRMLDVCAPGGGFYFGFDRHVLDIKSIDVKKLQAVCDYVHLNTNY
ncbi:MAG: hypothetical protein LBU28_04700 [Spirochaetaceae bacterium]|jgi:hypothetical protein|nr:hypothetical protein [Spirochaetaceae bacterium]